MSDPNRPPEDQLKRDPLPNAVTPAESVTGSWVPDPYASRAYLAPEDEPVVVHQERLFPRKVLVGWSLAALIFWFLITYLAPIVRDTVKESVITSIKEAAKESQAVTAPPTPAAVHTVPTIPATPATPAEPRPPAHPSVRR